MGGGAGRGSGGSIRIGLLGPTLLERDGASVALWPKGRTVLAALAVAGPGGCSEARLVEAVWPEGAPPTARRTLQAHISRVRGALGSAATVSSSPTGYRIEATGPDLHVGDDVAAARASLAAALQLSGAGRPGEAVAACEAATGLWRGRGLADLAGVPWAMPHVVELDALRLAVVEARVDAGLAAGRHAALVGELAVLVVDHPASEALAAARAVALYRCGRQAEALRSLAGVAERSAGGLAPKLAALEAALLAHDPALDLPVAAGAQPGGVSRVVVPLPEPFRIGHLAPHVDRQGATAAVVAAFDRAVADGPQLVVVEGEPGIGKTRLAAEAARALHGRGATILAGVNSEVLATPYEPFAEAIRRLAGSLDLGGVFGPAASELARLVPELGGGAPSTAEPETARLRLLDALVRAVEALAARGAVVLVVDDLHWAERSTVLALAHLTANLRVGAVLVVVTVRGTELHANPAASSWLAGLARSGDVGAAATRIHLERLDLAGTLALCEGAAREPLGESGRDLAAAVHATAEGNPFVTEEVLRHLVDRGVVVRHDGSWHVTRPHTGLGLPDSVGEVLRRRVATLDPPVQDLLRTAALVGRRHHPATLAAAHPEVPLAEALREASNAGMLRDAGGSVWEFTHALIPEALVADIGPLERAHRHARIAAALDEVTRRGVEVAPGEAAHHHLRAVAVAGAGPAALACLAASRDALARLAPDLAATFAAEGLAVATADPLVAVGLQVALAEARYRSGQGDHRSVLEAAWVGAAATADAATCAAAALACSRGYWSGFGQVDAGRVAALELAIDLAGDRDTPTTARLLAELAAELAWDHQLRARYRRLSDVALSMARRLGDPATVAAVLVLRLATLGGPTTLDERAVLAEELRPLADALGDPVRIVQALTHQIFCDIERARPDRLEALHARLVEVAPMTGHAAWEYTAHHATINLLCVRGTPAALRAEAERACRIGERLGLTEAFEVASMEQAVALGWEEDLEPMLELVEAVAGRQDMPALQAWCADCLARTGRHGRAAELLDSWVAGAWRVPPDHSQATSWATLASAAFEVGHRAAAEALVELLDPLRGRVLRNPVNVAGPAERPLAKCAWVLGDLAGHDRDMARSLEVARTMRSPMWEARIHLDWARTLAGRDAATAARHAASALDRAEEVGLAGVAARLADLLAVA